MTTYICHDCQKTNEQKKNVRFYKCEANLNCAMASALKDHLDIYFCGDCLHKSSKVKRDVGFFNTAYYCPYCSDWGDKHRMKIID